MIQNYSIEVWKPLLWQAQEAMVAVRKNLVAYAGFLRNVNVDIWTESPTDDSKLTSGRDHYSLEGWRIYVKTLNTRVANFDTQYGANVQAYDPAAKAAIDGFRASIPALNTAFNNCIANYKDASQNVVQRLVSQADRNALATAIEAQIAA